MRRRSGNGRKFKERVAGGDAGFRGQTSPRWDALVTAAAQASAYGDGRDAFARVRQLADRALQGDAAGLSEVLGTKLVTAVSACWDRGWQPADLTHVVGRQLKSDHRRVLADVVALEAAAYVYAVHADPGWLAQVDAVTPDVAPPDRHGLLTHWTATRFDTYDAIATAVEILGYLWRLPTQPRLCPPPSAWGQESAAAAGASATGRRRSGGGGGAHAADPKVTQRVRALLAKAESTDFPEEAEAFTAKAQELIARHAIDQAMLDAGADHPGRGTAGRRLLIDDPYAKAKSLLLNQVVAANRCTCVWHPDFSMSTVFGQPGDIDAVELLFTSLLTQGTAAMVTAGRSLGAQARERSFRQSFLVAFASRIGERLSDATAAAVDAAREEHGDGVLPVLANSEAAAAAARTEAFPNLKTQRISTSNYHGWIAGQAAADAARLGPEATLNRAP